MNNDLINNVHMYKNIYENTICIVKCLTHR